MAGRLELIIGPMFSGKMEELLRRARRHKIAGQNVLLIKHSSDDRYSVDAVSTHNGQQMPCITTNNLFAVIDKSVNVILVDETQFFGTEQVYKFYYEMVVCRHCILICAGLDAKFNMDPFPSVLQLIPWAENIVKLTAICMECRTSEASFSKRLESDNNDEVLVGGADDYHAVCRACYESK